MNDTSTDIEELVKKLSIALDAQGEHQPLNGSEMATVRSMIRAYSMLLSWGKLGRFLIWVVLTAAAVKAGADLLMSTGASH